MTESSHQLPPVIEAYQSAHDRHDVEAALATFTEAAVVHDEDQDWSGLDGIRQWLVKTNSEYTYTRTLQGVEATGDGSWLVRNRLEGNFPGGVVDLRYDFVVDGERISRLSIAP